MMMMMIRFLWPTAEAMRFCIGQPSITVDFVVRGNGPSQQERENRGSLSDPVWGGRWGPTQDRCPDHGLTAAGLLVVSVALVRAGGFEAVAKTSNAAYRREIHSPWKVGGSLGGGGGGVGGAGESGIISLIKAAKMCCGCSWCTTTNHHQSIEDLTGGVPLVSSTGQNEEGIGNDDYMRRIYMYIYASNSKGVLWGTMVKIEQTFGERISSSLSLSLSCEQQGTRERLNVWLLRECKIIIILVTWGELRPNNEESVHLFDRMKWTHLIEASSLFDALQQHWLKITYSNVALKKQTEYV